MTTLESEMTTIKSDMKSEMTTIKSDISKIMTVFNERLSATRQASKINADDLASTLEVMKLRVVPAEGSPDISTLFDSAVSESDVHFW